MNALRIKRPSTALVVGMVALFVALGGTAGAVVTAAVPLAKRALVADKAKTATTAKTAKVADNAKRLGGGTVDQVILAAATVGAEAALELSPEGPRPASTAAGLVTVRTSSIALGATERKAFVVSCDPGQKALGGGYSTFGLVVALGSFPTSNGTAWHLDLENVSDPASATTGNVYVTCLR